MTGISGGWAKWRQPSRVSCDLQVHYDKWDISAIWQLYFHCYAVLNVDQQRNNKLTNYTLLRCMCGVIRKGGIRNQYTYVGSNISKN